MAAQPSVAAVAVAVVVVVVVDVVAAAPHVNAHSCSGKHSARGQVKLAPVVDAVVVAAVPAQGARHQRRLKALVKPVGVDVAGAAAAQEEKVCCASSRSSASRCPAQLEEVAVVVEAAVVAAAAETSPRARATTASFCRSVGRC